MGLMNNYIDDLNIDTSNYSSTFLFEAIYPEYGNRAYQERLLWSLSQTPDFIDESSTDGAELQYPFLNIPLYTRLVNIPMDTVDYKNLFIQLNDPNDHATVDSICDDFISTNADFECYKGYEQDGGSGGSSLDTSQVKSILDKVFYGLIGVTMFLCFFSLAASMSANLYEQRKEVGVLRAMGFTKYRVRMLYFYEALIMVLSSCILGVLIGVVVGYTMLLQFNLFLGVKVPPFFPWGQFILVVIISLFCALFSTCGPAARLTNRSIAGIFRLV